MFVSAVIVAAGRGKRLGSAVSKQYLPLAGRPLLAHTLGVFKACDLFDELLLVISAAEEDRCRSQVIDPYFPDLPLRIVHGGSERQQSVGNALQALDARCQAVCVHDGVRPLVSVALLEAVVRGLSDADGAVAAVPVKETIKVATADRRVVATMDRSALWSVQTPQCFRRELLVRAHREAPGECAATDDAQLVERAGGSVRIIPGSYDNIKITTVEDLLLAEMLLQRRQAHARGDRQ